MNKLQALYNKFLALPTYAKALVIFAVGFVSGALAF